MAENVQVFCRVRPPNSREMMGGAARRCVSADAVEGQSLVLASSMAKKEAPRNFYFDRVFGERSTQEQVFDVIGRPITTACLEGYNGTIFAYGQTGSGKTFTMLGEEDQRGRPNVNKGLVPRVLEYLFEKRDVRDASSEFEATSTIEYKYICSFLEIYNERVFDLLDGSTSEAGLNLRENHVKGVFVEGLKEATVENAQQATELMTIGTQNRHVGHTSMNRESSRSHSVFILQIHSKETTASGLIKKRQARFNLVDLAGSERQKSTEAAGDRLKEAGNINKSLSALGNVIMALSEQAVGKTRHVHYRDSKLTYLLKDSLGGNSKTFMIAAISPAEDCMSETHSTLKFAQRAKMIKNNAFINEDTSGNIFLLQEEIKRLRLQLQQAGDPGSNNVHHERGSLAMASSLPPLYNPFSELNDNPLPSDCDPAVDTRFRELENTLSNIVDEHSSQKRSLEVLQLRESHYRELCAQLKRKGLHLRFLLKLKADKETNVEHIERIQQELEYNPSVDAIEWRLKYDEIERLYMDLQEDVAAHTPSQNADEVMRLQHMHFEVAKQLSLVIKDKHALQVRIGGSVLDERMDAEPSLEWEAKVAQAQALQSLAEDERAKTMLETLMLREKVRSHETKLALQQDLLSDFEHQIRVLQEVHMAERTSREAASSAQQRAHDDALHALQTQHLACEYAMTTMRQQLSGAEAQAAQWAEREAHWATQVATAEGNIRDLTAQVRTFSEESHDMHEKVQAAAARETTLQATVAALQVSLQAHAAASDHATASLEAQVHELTARIDELMRIKTDLEATAHASIEALEAKEDAYQATLGAVEQLTFDLAETKAAHDAHAAESADALAAELTHRETEVAAMTAAINELHTKLASANEGLADLVAQVAALEAAKADVEAALKEWQLQAADAETTVASLRDELEAKDDALQATIGDVERLTHELAQAAVAHGTVEANLVAEQTDKAAQVTALQAMLDAKVRERDALQEDKVALEAAMAELSAARAADAAAFEAKLTETREASDVQEDKLQAALGDIERLQYEASEASKLYAALQASYDAMTAEKTALEASVAALQMHVRDLETSKASLETALASSTTAAAADRASFESQLETASAEQAALAQEHREAIAAVEALLESARSDLDAKEDALQEVLGNVERLEFELETMSEARTAVEKDLATTQMTLEATVAAMAAKEADLAAVRSALEDAQGETIVVNNLLQQSHDEKSALKTQSSAREEALVADVAALTAKVADANTYNDVLRSTLQLDKDEFTAQIKTLEESLAAATAKVPPLVAEVAALKKEAEASSASGLAALKDKLREDTAKLAADRKHWKYKNESLMLKAIENEYAMNQAKRENERLLEDMAELHARLDALNDEKDKLVGHHNAKQKIQHHAKMKEDVNRLQAELRAATDENFKLKKRIEKLEVLVAPDTDMAAALGSPLKRQKSLNMMPAESPMRGKRPRP
ncbi:kinesin family member 15 [Saprolegnia diclina VS20]|uniref:Kinesin family member 15 n=1 Tax=Saprolegnia diclina (strain VS20) TaxID=1156394 RepID=T0RYJ2_SAPDV|nr:kinesin family member 15 [Saprolegnia diclina VS20]EQC37648.1 kinesin family member 15 [Saprolegnia diclina VS20]|eukprot:XP_008609168.1 kinesin family member 15 [Saprolegnia diclina VS20]